MGGAGGQMKYECSLNGARDWDAECFFQNFQNSGFRDEALSVLVNTSACSSGENCHDVKIHNRLSQGQILLCVLGRSSSQSTVWVQTSPLRRGSRVFLWWSRSTRTATTTAATSRCTGPTRRSRSSVTRWGIVPVRQQGAIYTQFRCRNVFGYF